MTDADLEGPPADLVVCSLEAWDEVWRRNQFLVRELLALDPTRRVLFVEPPFDVVHERRASSGRVRQRGLRPVPDRPRVVRFEPTKWWPNRAGPMADASLRRQVRAAAAAIGLTAPTLWINDAGYAGLATETGWPAVYDITDDWTLAGGGARATARVAAQEAGLFAEVDRVVVCSSGLAASRRAARADLVVIPNGVDVEHLTRPRPRPVDLPSAPTAVYVGTLHEDRLDLDLIESLARARPDLQITLVGPDALGPSSRVRLDALGNVHRLGPRPYAEVPAYLQHGHVIVVPHVVSPFTESLDPIKAYECVALGRPTVATPVAGFRELGPPIRVASGQAFVTTVSTLVDRAANSTGEDPATVEPTRGEPPSWRQRAVEFDRELTLAAQPAPRAWRGAPRRVVFVDHCADLSGGELALAQLLPALVGIEPHVVLGQDGPLEAVLEDLSVRVEVQLLDAALADTRRDELGRAALDPRRALAAADATARLTRRLRQLQPDVVHTNSLKAAVYGGLAGRLAGVPVVWHVRDRIAGDYLPTAVVRTVRSLARVVPSAIIANSQATLDTLGVGPAGQPRVVIHDAVAIEATRPRRVHEGFRVAMVGRLAPWKGQAVFLEALARAFGDEAFEAVIVGRPMFGDDEVDYEHQLRASIERLGLAGRVTMSGFVDDIGEVLAEVDCLVHASVIPEPFGQVVLEGMASGLAVIAAAGGPSEIITDGVDGLLYPPGDGTELARLLRVVAADPRLRQRLGDAARLRASRFSPERSAAQVEQLYDRLSRRRSDGSDGLEGSDQSGGAGRAGLPHGVALIETDQGSVVHLGSPRQLGRGLAVARRLRAPLVVEWGGGDAGRRPGRAVRRLLLRLAKPVLVIGAPGERAGLGAIPSALVPGGSWADTNESRTALDELYRRLTDADAGPRFVAVDGRYANRPMTGVERVADRIVSASPGPVAVFAPSPRWSRGVLGHLWEQLVLPARLWPYRTRLWSPCNFGPMLVRHQIVTIHDVAPVDQPEWFTPGYRLWARLQWRVLYRRAATVTVVSAFTRNRLAAHWGTRPGVHVIPNGADHERIEAMADEMADAPADAPVGAEPETAAASVPPAPTVCVVGSLEPRKNLATLLAAMVEVRAEHPTCRLTLIGQLGDPRVFAPDSGIDLDQDWIDRLGRVDDEQLHRVVAASTCLAYVSRYEGFGLPPLDAMAVGTPVVASDLPALAEVIKGAAVLVDPTDVTAVAAGIGQVLSWSDRERAAAITRGRRRAARYTWTGAADALDELVWPVDR